MRKLIIAGNWKMNTTLSDGVELAKAVSEVESTGSNVIVVICPPFTHIKSIKDAVFGRGISIGAQNIHWENGGAFTGEISANTLKELKCEYVIIGHSERRQYFGENDNTVNKKMLKALETGLIPILCIGESLEERSAGQTFKVLERQLELGLKGVVVKSGVELVIAYEPIWAIGTGQTATTEQAQDAHNFVRSQLIKLLGSNIADTVIKSPIDGVIAAKYVNEKEDVQNVVAFKVVNSSSMVAEIKVPESVVADLRIGQEAFVYINGDNIINK